MPVNNSNSVLFEKVAAVQCHEVSLKVRKKNILDEVSFHIPQGSITLHLVHR